MQHDVQKMECNLLVGLAASSAVFKAVHYYNYGKALIEADNQRLNGMKDELVHKFCADSCTGHAACMLLYAAVRIMHASLAVAYGLQQPSHLLKGPDEAEGQRGSGWSKAAV